MNARTWSDEVFDYVTSRPDFFIFAGTRLFPDVAPPNQKGPYFVWQQITGGGSSQHDGPCDVKNPIVQYVCWADKRSVADAGRDLLSGFLSSKVIPSTLYDIAFTYSDEDSLYDPETKRFGAALDLRAHIKNLN